MSASYKADDAAAASSGGGDDYSLLSTTCPLLCTIISSLVLASTILFRPLNPPVSGESPTRTRTTRSKSTQDHSHLRSDNGDRQHHENVRNYGSALCEAAIIVYALSLVVQSYDFSHGKSQQYEIYVGIISWTYLLALSLLALYGNQKASLLSNKLRIHTTLLYGLHWSITALLYGKSVLSNGIPPWTSPLSQGFGACSLLLGLRLLEKTQRITRESRSSGPAQRDVYTSLVGQATFSWLDQIIWIGFRKRLEEDDIFDLPPNVTCSTITGRFTQEQYHKPYLTWQLLHFLRYQLPVQCIYAALAAITSYVPTLAMQSVLHHVENGTIDISGEQLWTGLAVMLVSGIVYAIADSQAGWRSDIIRLEIRDIIIDKIYRKVMKRTARAAEGATNSQQRSHDGTITNLVSMDADKIAENVAHAYEMITTIPIRLAIALYLLYRLLGIASFAGIAIMLSIAPLNAILYNHMGQAAAAVMAATDIRIQETDRILRNVRLIKLFAWQDFFRQRLVKKRDQELMAIKSSLSWWTIFSTIWYIVPSFITFAAFLTYTVVQQQPFTSSTAFTALALFGLLKAPLDKFNSLWAGIQESLQCLQRVETFLQENETSKFEQQGLSDTTEIRSEKQFKECIQQPRSSHEAYGFQDVVLTHGSELPEHSTSSVAFSLRIKALTFKPGCLHLIAGATGSGKTSLLLGLLGEMTLLRGKSFCAKGAVSYCAQEAWLVHDSIKNNILFTSAWDEDRYKATIDACALAADLDAFDLGDETVVGEKGAALSGGQKQRVALARALYARTECVLLDDCLSAVDSNTAKWLAEKCIAGPLMKGRTCIIATHNVAILSSRVDSITILSQGTVKVTGPWSEIKDTPDLLELSDTSSTTKVDTGSAQIDPEVLQNQDIADPTVLSNGKDAPDSSTKALKTPHQIEKQARELLAERPAGNIPLSVLSTYLRAMGGPVFWIAIVVAFVLQQLTTFTINWWLGHFTDTHAARMLSRNETSSTAELFDHRLQRNTVSDDSQVGIWLQFGIYALLLAFYTFVNLVRLRAASNGAVMASTTLHNRLLGSILHAKFQFFDATNHGMLLRCFTQDIQTLDHHTMPMALGTMHFLVLSISTVLLITVLVPSFLLPGTLIFIVFVIIGQLSLDSSRELERIKSQQQEPLQQHLSESLLGLVTIRAFHQELYFANKNNSKIDISSHATLYAKAVDHWLTVRLNLTGTIMSFAAGFLALASRGKFSSGSIGLMLTYTLTFSDNIMWMVRYHSLNQKNFSAIERLKDVTEIDSESYRSRTSSTQASDWPSRGSIEFKNYSTTYRHDLPDVLRQLQFRVEAGQHIAIVGRTGAGKSSITLAILRALEATRGSIEIDGVDITNVQLNTLRQAIGLVPQDPYLFAGSLQENLDPFDDFSTEQIRAALKSVGFATDDDDDGDIASTEHDSKAPPTKNQGPHHSFIDLQKPIEEGGANFSLGQRQLICLARVLLRSPKIVILDEATASVDHKTDSMIKGVIATLPTTVITIAHRLTSVLNYDAVLVLEQGQIAEFGSPRNLIQKKGPFRALCEDHGNIKELEETAEMAWRINSKRRT